MLPVKVQQNDVEFTQCTQIMYLNTHAALESMRAKVEEELRANTFSKAQGPRLMVTGPVDVGKSTLCRILANYATRQGRAVMFVDLDVGQRTISIPGSIGALFVERPADIVDGFDQTAAFVYNVSGMLFRLTKPICSFYSLNCN